MEEKSSVKEIIVGVLAGETVGWKPHGVACRPGRDGGEKKPWSDGDLGGEVRESIATRANVEIHHSSNSVLVDELRMKVASRGARWGGRGSLFQGGGKPVQEGDHGKTIGVFVKGGRHEVSEFLTEETRA